MMTQALARSPGDPLGTELLNLALQDQTDSMLYATSKSGAVRFPHLANDVAVRDVPPSCLQEMT